MKTKKEEIKDLIDFEMKATLNVPETVKRSFEAGVEWKRQKAIEAYRSLCPFYKIKIRDECGNHSHRQEWKITRCDMNCQYLKNLMEKI